MSWRDNSSSSNRSSTNDGSGGSRDAGGNVHGTGSGSGPGGRGGLTGQRSQQPAPGRLSPLRPTPIAPRPLSPMMPPAIPPSIPPSNYPIPGQVMDYFSQPTRMDPGILAQMLGQNRIQPAGINMGRPSSFPARPGATTRVGQPRDPYENDRFGSSFGGFGPPGPAKSGGGFGGGGGGGF